MGYSNPQPQSRSLRWVRSTANWVMSCWLKWMSWHAVVFSTTQKKKKA